MMRKCHLNVCGVGVATQDPKLRAKFRGKPEHIVSYFMWVAQDVRRVMAQLGVCRFDDLVGRVDLLQRRDDLHHDKACALDVSPLLSTSGAAPVHGPVVVPRVDVGGDRDHALLHVVDDVVAGRVVEVAGVVGNVDRAVGTTLSGEIARRGGAGAGGLAVCS